MTDKIHPEVNEWQNRLLDKIYLVIPFDGIVFNSRKDNKIIKIIYTTYAVESYHRAVREFTKSKSIFPTDDSIRKAIYLNVKEIPKK